MTDQSNSPASPASAPLVVGRLQEATDEFVAAFTASVTFDQRLYAHDIRGSIAHTQMLEQVGVLSADEASRIVTGLQSIHKEIEDGRFQWQVALEDVHMNIESRLIELIGEDGKKLHTGRSRNDQVATDLRLYLRDEIDAIDGLMARVQTSLVDLAEGHTDTLMPGFTHLQPAQPVTFGHHLMAWFEMLARDRERLADCRKRTNRLPLGAAALAGTSYPIDRAHVARLLEFEALAENSLDAVSDRDFAIEFAAVASLTLNHLSRWCEELVLWSSSQIGFVTLPDRFCTGSSIMPQKKNPDVPELIRGKTGRVTGHLVSLLTLMKSQPLAYNKDNQEDKEPVFDTVDTVKACLLALADLIPHIEPNVEKLRAAAIAGFTTATDLADYLVKRGLPFRDAHAVVGKVVAHAIGQAKELHELSLEDLQSFTTLTLEGSVFEILHPDGSAAARQHIGGTAPARVVEAIGRARARI